jgi:peptide/nickel transport system ATP-binding protein
VSSGSAFEPALELVDIDVAYRVRGVDRQVLRGVSLTVERGASYGLVGESGCGKSTAALAIVRYLPRNGRVRSGEIRIAGRDVVSLSRPELRRLRANDVSMVYQNPGSSLNPSIRVGKQVAEVFTVRGVKHDEALELALGALAKVQIADPRSVMAVPAPTLRRDAAACRDCDGARQGPGAADPRRADDRA